MTDGLDTQPSAATYDLEDLIAEAWNGTIRVPHFQRDFRWGPQDVVRLFDSIARGYPVGSLLMWIRKSPAATVKLGSLRIEAKASDSALWVVDGQQRITSLANALHPEGNSHSPFSVGYDLLDRQFVITPTVQEPQFVPLPVLFDLEKLLDWFAGAGQQVSEHFPEARRVAKLLRQFKVPAYLVRQENEGILTDIFDRMNSHGKRLSRAEIFSALFAGPEAGADERLTIGSIAERIAARTGFGLIDDDTVLGAILARRGPDPSREIRTEFDESRRRTASEFPGEDRDTAYEKGEESIIRAVSFLQEGAGVPHLSLLSYRSLLVALTRFFAHYPEPEQRSLQQLRRVYWRVAASGPAVFKGSFTQISRVLSARIHPGDESRSVQALVETMDQAQPAMPNPERFKSNEAGAKLILCAWWALRPRSPFTGEQYGKEDLADVLSDQITAAPAVRRIFPRGLGPKYQFLTANRLFVPTEADPVDEIAGLLTRQPPGLDDSTWDAVLHSYCLDRHAARLLAVGNRNAFLEARQKIITAQLADFLTRMAEWKYGDLSSMRSQNLSDIDDVGELDYWSEDNT
ncbi:DUF262 domain-containing protein [Actinosynnema sp. NPDC020468]|uniref:GmrSD restriction endonuclease domain-containing protein n=1 Tax=Actinosynnema sp. NPDC020468 TaxID=3154488 RepID=UPI003407BDF0